MISEQYSIPSHDASTPQGQGVVAATATPKSRIKRRAVFTGKPSLKRRARARASSSANHDEDAPAPSGLESLAAAAGTVAAQNKQTELEPVPFASENYTFPAYVYRAAGEMIVNSGRTRYYNWLVESWKMQSEAWMVGHPIPSQHQAQIWVRYHKKKVAKVHPMSEESRVIKERQRMIIRVMQEDAANPENRLSLREMVIEVFSKSFGNILSLEGKPSPSMLLKLCLVSRRFHDLVYTSSEYKELQSDRRQQMDLDRIMQEVDIDFNAGDSAARIYQSEKQIPIEYGAASSELARLQDMRESLANLGDSLPFVDGLHFLGKGGFGAVFAVEIGGKHRMALKIGMNAVPSSYVSTLFLSEFTFSTMSNCLNKSRQSTRRIIEPFAPDVPTCVEDYFEGNACLAMPSKCNPNTYYPVLAMSIAKTTLQDLIQEVSLLFNDAKGKCRPEDFRSVASLSACVLEKLDALHCTGNCHRDVKGSNFLGFSYRPGMKGRVYTSPSGVRWVIRLSDYGKGLPFGQQVVSERTPVFLSPGKSSKSRQRSRGVLAQNLVGHNPVARNVSFRGIDDHNLAETVLEQRKSVEKLLKQEDLLPKQIAVKGGKAGAPGLHSISIRALHLQTGCFPSQAKDGDPPVPVQYARAYGTAHFAPPESQPARKEGQEFLSARAWQPGDMWATGLMIAEMVKGKGRRIVFSPNDNHGKVLFAEDNDKLFWNKHTYWATFLKNGNSALT